MCVCVVVYKFLWVCTCMLVCIYGWIHMWRQRGLYQVSLGLIFWHRASLFLLVWLVSESQRFSCLKLPNTKIFAVYLNSVPHAYVGSIYCLFQSKVPRHHVWLLITLAGNLVLILESQGEDLRRSIQTSRKRCVAGPSKENISYLLFQGFLGVWEVNIAMGLLFGIWKSVCLKVCLI